MWSEKCDYYRLTMWEFCDILYQEVVKNAVIKKKNRWFFSGLEIK